MGASGGGVRQVAPEREGAADRGEPLVAVELAPREQREPTARPEAVGDVGEGGDRVAEEHGAEVADGDVGGAGLERVHLGVALHEGDVADALGRGPLRGAARASATDRSMPSADPSEASRAASIVDRPVPQPMSSTRSPAPMIAGLIRCGRWRHRRALVAVGVARPSARPRAPSHASACSTLAISMAGLLGWTRIAPFGSNFYTPKGSMSMAGPRPAHLHVVRHPRPAVAPAVDHLRAGPADAASPRAVLAAGREQALRGAEEARRARPRQGDRRARRQAAPHRVRHHPRGPEGAEGVDAASRATDRSSSSRGSCGCSSPSTAPRTTCWPRSTRRTPGWSAATRRARASRAATSTARAASPSACPGSSCAVASSRR